MSNIIFLYGPPGSGKSTLAKAVSEMTGRKWIDLDMEIELAVGSSVAEMIEGHGIEQFREVEARCLLDVIHGAKAAEKTIVSLGGGALLKAENRSACEAAGKIVFLDTPAEVILSRVNLELGKRPLLNGNEEAKLKALLAERKEHYDSFKLRVGTMEENLGATVDKIENSAVFSVGAMGRPYDVLIMPGAKDHLAKTIAKTMSGGTVGLVFDTNTAKYYRESIINGLAAEGTQAKIHVIPAGEEFKTLETVQSLWDFYIQSGFDRNSLILAIGGGVVSDLVGFASATYMRGCQWLCVPTTLLSMVDASIGGKTGFDLPLGKNLIGAFYPPRAVVIDPDFLATLPEEEFISGMAEVIKHGIIADPSLFSDAAQGLETIQNDLTSIIARAVKVKVDVIEEDPFEKGRRAALNLGHTIGHAVELESGFKLKHGEAIAIGMVLEASVSEKLRIAAPGLTERIAAVLSRAGLPTSLPANADKKKIAALMWNDKKKSGKTIRFALPKNIGEVVTGVELDNLEEML